MVVFTCNHCGDSLQKPKVEKHFSFVCRAPKSLTCIDCLKDFRGEEYVSHTKCITEEERYAAKGTFVNGIIKKGEVKQESWIEMIKSIIEKETNLKPSIRNLLNTISNYDNVPRKKPKFLNFIKSSSGGRANMNDVEEVWNIIEKYKADQVKHKNNSESCQNGSSILEDNSDKTQISGKDNNTKESKKKKKEKQELNGNTETMEQSNKADTSNGENLEKPKKKSGKDNNTKESKKKKKEKQELNGNTETMEQSNKADTSNGENLEKPKKKKKKQLEESHLEIENADVNITSENNEDSIIKKKTKKKKLQAEETEETIQAKKPKLDVENVQEQMETNEDFDFVQKIVAILASKGSISKNKLEKKVVSAYLKHSGLFESSPKILKKFNKKLKKIDNIEIVDDTISLKTQ